MQGRKLAPADLPAAPPPLLTVIIANYNYGLYIRECLESILTQTFKNLEIIVFDDCSDDDSRPIIREFEHRYPGVVTGIFTPVKKGVTLARHEAILKSRADYITTIDSDDYYYDPRKLEKEWELITHHKQTTGKDIIAFSNIALVNRDKSVIRIQGSPDTIKEGNILKEIMTRSCMIPRDFIVSKEAYFAVGGYDRRFSIYEDWDLKIRLAQKYEYYYSGLTGIAYRRHGTGLSSLPIKDNLKWLKKVFKKNKKLAPKAEKKAIIAGFNQFVEKTEINQRLREKK